MRSRKQAINHCERATAEIAVGIIRLPETNQIFITQRPINSFLANYWELPGGKIEFGETPEQALIRELQEEIGINAIEPQPFQQFYYRYPEKTLIFHVFLVECWSGEPYGREQQASRWLSIPELNVHDFPEANRSLIEEIKQKWKNHME